MTDDEIYTGIPWEHRPRASWDLEEMHREFQERLYVVKGAALVHHECPVTVEGESK